MKICPKHLDDVKGGLHTALSSMDEFIGETRAVDPNNSTAYGTKDLRDEIAMMYRMVEALDKVLKVMEPDIYHG